MPELTKRINAGWVLMDSYTVDNNKFYFLEHGKNSCVIKLEPSGHGVLYTNSMTKVI